MMTSAPISFHLQAAAADSLDGARVVAEADLGEADGVARSAQGRRHLLDHLIHGIAEAEAGELGVDSGEHSRVGAGDTPAQEQLAEGGLGKADVRGACGLELFELLGDVDAGVRGETLDLGVVDAERHLPAGRLTADALP